MVIYYLKPILIVVLIVKIRWLIANNNKKKYILFGLQSNIPQISVAKWSWNEHNEGRGQSMNRHREGSTGFKGCIHCMVL